MSDSFKAIADKNNKLYGKTKKYADIAYFVAVLFIVAGRAMVLTRHSNDIFVTTIVYAGSALLFLIGAYRLFFQFFKNWKKALLGLLVVIFSFIYSEFSSSASEFPVVALAIVGAMDVSADSILLAGIIGNLVMIANNVIVAFFNSGNDMYAYDSNDFFYLGDNYVSFPTFNNFSSTDFAAHYFWIIAAFLWIRGKKITWCEIFAVGALDAMVYSMTGSNTSLIGISLLFFLTFGLKLWLSISQRSHSCEKAVPSDKKNIVIYSLTSISNNLIGFGIKYSYVIFAVVTILLTVFYNTGIPVFYMLNNMLHHRLGLGHKGIVEYGIHPFASGVRVYGSNSSIDGYYNFIDCSYVSVLVRGGIIPLLFYVGSLTTIQLRHKKFLYGAALLAVCALSCVEEHHMAELPYNFFILLLFADYNLDKKTGVDSLKKQTKKVISGLSFALCGVFAVSTMCINIPRINLIKELDMLDSKATQIYIAVQGDLDRLVENGTWKMETSSMSSSMYGEVVSEPEDFIAVTGTTWKEQTSDPKAHSYYAVYYDNDIQTASDSVLTLLISDKTKELIGNGSVVIEYDVQTAELYSVWYSEQPGCYVIKGSGARTSIRRPQLSGKESKEGYSTGG